MVNKVTLNPLETSGSAGGIGNIHKYFTPNYCLTFSGVLLQKKLKCSPFIESNNINPFPKPNNPMSFFYAVQNI